MEIHQYFSQLSSLQADINYPLPHYNQQYRWTSHRITQMTVYNSSRNEEKVTEKMSMFSKAVESELPSFIKPCIGLKQVLWGRFRNSLLVTKDITIRNINIRTTTDIPSYELVCGGRR